MQAPVQSDSLTTEQPIRGIRWWYISTFAIVTISLMTGTYAKSHFWSGNAFCHELSFADESLSDQTEVLFLGSSHVFQGVDPRLIDANCSNLGYPEANLSVCKMLFDRHVNELPNLKLVVVQCESWSFWLDSIQRQKFNYRTLLDQRVHLSNVDLPLQERARATLRTMTGVDYPPVTPADLSERQILQTQWRGVPGFKPPWPKEESAETEPEQEASAKTELPRAKASELHALNALIEECQNRNIGVVLIRYPHTKAYERRADSEEWSKITRELITSRKITAADIWDYYGGNILEFDDKTDFADSNHLHPDTIPRFCESLNDKVNLRLLRD